MNRAYLLDTDWLIDHLAGDPDDQTLILVLNSGGIVISVVSFMEVYEGIERSATRREDARAFRTFPDGVMVLPVNRSVACRTARVRAELRAAGRSVRPRALDLLIAATAPVYDLTLVTRTEDDYRDIHGLKLYRTTAR